MSRFIALDLGAESGRVVVAEIEEAGIRLEECCRFATGAVRVHETLRWDVLGMFREIKAGLGQVRQEYGDDFVSLGVDTWGIDYALLDKTGDLISNPYCYRDGRTAGVMERVLEKVPRQEVFEKSGGIQFLPINTLYQLASMAMGGSQQLDIAETLLMMPDLFNYWLTGEKVNEFTDATSTQLYDSRQGRWSLDLMRQVGIPDGIFQEVIEPGTELGHLLPEVRDEIGLSSPVVVAPAAHDTASAVVAVPAAGERFAWLSSGTWSLPGVLSPSPLVSEEALAYNISSYGGAGGMFLPWKNVMGLWLVQECRRIWARDGDAFSYGDLTQMAAAARPFLAVIEPDDPSFLAPDNMPRAIQAFCQRTGQAVPETKGEIVRVALEALALKYRWVYEKLQLLVGESFDAVHVVGGGSKNALLCQFTADALQTPVVAGPVEATALGNVAVQAVSTGHLSSLQEARQLIRQSADVITYEPVDGGTWDEAYARFLKLMG
jgi:rhamnulokinase